MECNDASLPCRCSNAPEVERVLNVDSLIDPVEAYSSLKQVSHKYPGDLQKFWIRLWHSETLHKPLLRLSP